MISVLVQGTNCTGKSTLMRNLILHFGGVSRTEGKDENGDLVYKYVGK